MNNKIIDETTYNFILSNTLLFNSLLSNELLAFYIDKVINEIVIKTNRVKFPEDLKYLAIDMINNMFSLYNEDTKNITGQNSNQNIQSMSESGRSITFGASDYSKEKLNLLLQQQMTDNETQINRYKLLYRVRSI